MSEPFLLEMRRATAHRGAAFRLGPVDLAVASGEVVAVVGPNGAGKSTLLALAVGEVPADGGEVLLGGRPHRDLARPDVARRAASCRQRPAGVFEQSALEVVLHGRWIHGTGLRFPGPSDLARAHAELERLRAGHLADRDFRTLSGGEQQRVLLAKALAQDARLLLLDEPTTGLDLRHRWELMGLIATLPELSRGGVLLVTHDLDLAAAVASRALLLKEGQVVVQGPLEAVFRPESLEEVLEFPVEVDTHPATGRPRVSPRSRAR